MRTRFTNEDVKYIVENIFNGNLKQTKINDKIIYKNPFSEEIYIKNEDTDETQIFDLAKYLNIDFYTWKNRIVDVSSLGIDERMTPFDLWAQSMNLSMDKTFALVEVVDEEVQVSQDIDNAIKSVKITFLIQTDKAANLDYYTAKIRNELLGKVQTIYNSYGQKLKAFINLGTLIYETEPTTIQFGSCIQCSCSLEISYMADALSYEDINVSISLDGENGEYLEMPISKATYQMLCSGNAEPTAVRPDLTGVVNTTISWIKTFSFFDFNKELTNRINRIFWEHGSYKSGETEGSLTSNIHDPNILVFVKIKTQGMVYLYKDTITEIEKITTNGDFSITSITLKGYGKIG